MSEQTQSNEGNGKGFFSREAVSGVSATVMGKFILFFLYFGVSILTVNGLGKEKYGVFSLLTNISSYLLVLCGLGLGSALMRYVPELTTRKNRRGLILLMWKSAALQAFATGFFTALVLRFSGPLQKLFNAEHVERFPFYLMLACGLVALLLFKDFITTVFTSIFKTRIVAVLGVCQGIIWLVLLWVGMRARPEIEMVLCAQMIAIGCVYLFGMVMLVRHVHGLPWRVKEFGIGKRRALRFSGVAMLSAVLRVVMFKYSEVFFLAAVGGTTIAGVYDLGYSLPYTVVTFIPLALLPLFTAAFAEAYVRDNNCLDCLIGAYYKLLMMVSLPVAILGSFFARRAYHILYQGTMDDAGRLASAFCVVLLLPLVSIPLSMALKAKEKVHNMLPLLLLQIGVNLFLDWLFIVEMRWGAWGGMLAVVGTFVLTITPRMMVVRRIIGGIHFPAAFFLRISIALAVSAAGVYWVADVTRLFEQFESEWVNIGLLFVVAGVYALVFLVLVRAFRLIRREDIADFHALEIKRLNKVLGWLTGA
jgi:O-antigen/teichoic acid export membrane protein